MRKRARQAKRAPARAVVQSALIADTNAVVSTPVDTGAARSNWILSKDAPSYHVIEPYSPGSALGSGEGANASAAIGQARSIAQSVSEKDPDPVLWLNNNVRYIRRLNEGYSAQAPALFVETSILKAQQWLRGFKVFSDR